MFFKFRPIGAMYHYRCIDFLCNSEHLNADLQ